MHTEGSEVLSVRWYRAHCGGAAVECRTSTDAGPATTTTTTVEEFLAAAATPGPTHLAVRDAPCPAEWRTALETALQDVPLSPRAENTATTTLPFVPQHISHSHTHMNANDGDVMCETKKTLQLATATLLWWCFSPALFTTPPHDKSEKGRERRCLIRSA